MNESEQGAQVVWLKRDLRSVDHQPLLAASRRGPVVCLYVYEPELYESEEFDSSHLKFVNQSLATLDERLRAAGVALTFRVGRMPDVLDKLHREIGIATLWAHEETGNALTYARDRRVRRWARTSGIPFREFPQTGVVRPLRDRDGWAAAWQTRMQRLPLPAPEALRGVAGLEHERIRRAADLGLPPSARSGAQAGGESIAQETLHSFLERRGREYRKGMSSPVTAWEACSRLSPHLAWGTISINQLHHALEARRAELRQATDEPGWLQSLQSFAQRLRWHCHFMQKLEDQPSLEFENMSRAFDGMRENDFDDDRFQAWCHGRTGYPLVDACMRALHETGWINFRMRAMLVSFASHHLWLHWRPTAVFLARHFLDFEPGIHFSQVQMQSGTTGINTVRIYSPIKQALDQDPSGAFIRRWVPELAGVPDDFVHQPEQMPTEVQRRAGCRIGRDYPAPIVEHAVAYREARSRIAAVRRRPEAREEAKRVYHRHGSRRRPSRRRARTRASDSERDMETTHG